VAPGRALSGWLLALSSTSLAVAGHGWAGGGVPDIALVVPITALIAWAGMALANRLRGMVALTAALAVIQLGLHQLLSRSAGSHGGHGAEQVVDGAAMLAVHAIATLVTAALLARASNGLALGSAAAEWLLATLRTLRLGQIPVPAEIGVAHAIPARPGQLLEIMLRRVSARRGPPAHS
jgi:hypothetical protein